MTAEAPEQNGILEEAWEETAVDIFGRKIYFCKITYNETVIYGSLDWSDLKIPTHYIDDPIFWARRPKAVSEAKISKINTILARHNSNQFGDPKDADKMYKQLGTTMIVGQESEKAEIIRSVTRVGSPASRIFLYLSLRNYTLKKEEIFDRISEIQGWKFEPLSRLELEQLEQTK